MQRELNPDFDPEILRVSRGGSWCHDPSFARVADRYNGAPSFRFCNLGFRLVHEADTPRVLRGGGWGGDPAFARVANRGSSAPGGRSYYLGFRLAKEST